MLQLRPLNIRHGLHLALGALLLFSFLALPGCATSRKLSVQKTQINDDVEKMHSRAYRCTPKELALAEAHAEFGALELSQGNLWRAEDHILFADQNSETADLGSRDQACMGEVVVVASDRDGDGYLDPEDSCPDQPEDFDGDEDEDGCPDIELDKDGDGILDNDDRCPLDPEDYDAFEDPDGCPEPDNDQDLICDPWVAEKGLLDQYECQGTDQCPDEPEDMDGFEDEDGCPDIDNDNDKILDVVDACPLDPEDYDGDTDEDGCPEERKLVKVTDDKIELNEKVYFATDKTKVLSKSEPLLDEIASVLNDNANIHIRIEGHTDDRGSRKYNQKLSQGRADSVMTELITRGISPDRMVAEGFGEDNPIDTNETKDGRANNRRVELHITKK